MRGAGIILKPKGKTSITEQKVNVIHSDNVDMIRKICREGKGKRRWKVE